MNSLYMVRPSILLYSNLMTYRKASLTIVVIAYNEEKYIGNCLEAIAAQTVAPDEVIVVDNNSKDRTGKIAKSFSFVRVVNELEQGIAPARNRGFNEASSKLIARIDSDTQLPPGWVAAAHEVLDGRAETITAASGPAYVYDLPIKATRKLVGDLVINLAYFKLSRLMLGHQTLFGSSTVITKLAWEKVKNEVCNDSHEVHEDMDLALHIARFGDVLYDARLSVGIAKRSLDEPVRKTLWRIRIWPHTVTRHRKLFAKYTSVS